MTQPRSSTFAISSAPRGRESHAITGVLLALLVALGNLFSPLFLNHAHAECDTHSHPVTLSHRVLGTDAPALDFDDDHDPAPADHDDPNDVACAALICSLASSTDDERVPARGFDLTQITVAAAAFAVLPTPPPLAPTHTRAHPSDDRRAPFCIGSTTARLVRTSHALLI